MRSTSGSNRPDGPEIDEAIREAQEVLLDDCRGLRSLLYRDMLLNALKCRRDELDILDLKIITRAVSDFRHAACVFKPYRDIRKVSIFGSARVADGTPDYKLAVRLGRLLAESRYMVITGAAEGIMKAGIEGAGADNSFGVKLLLPFENSPAKIIENDPKLVRFKYFFTRKIFFVMEADAIALFPGGFGTHDEGFEVLTLLQTGKAPPMPVALLELPGEGYWESWDQFIREHLLACGFISPEDLSFYRIFHSAEDARDWIMFYYSTYHSMRQVGDRLVIRLERELSDDAILELNQAFPDLVGGGEIARTAALAEEEDEARLLSRPRIVFPYDRKHAGRLNELVLMVNRLGRGAREPGADDAPGATPGGFGAVSDLAQRIRAGAMAVTRR